MPTPTPRRARGAIAVALLALAGAAPALGACAGRTRGHFAPRPVTAVPAPGRGPLAPADALLRAGDADGALALYEAEIERDPAAVRAHLHYVAAALDARREPRARATYLRRTASPSANEADRVMSARLATDGSPAAVRAVYADAAAASPGNAWWRLALAEVDLAAAEGWMRHGEAARVAGDRDAVEGARGHVERALASAADALDRATERDAGLAEIPLYRGLLHALRADAGPKAERAEGHRAAAAEYRRATRADPHSVDAWAALGDALARTGDAEGALAAWQEAVRLVPADPDLRDGAALALHELERHAEAAAEFETSARLRPADPRPLLDAGEEWAAACRWDDALSAYARALARDPKAAEAHARRGAALERLGRIAEAREAYAAYVAVGGPRTEEMRRRVERLSGVPGAR